MKHGRKMTRAERKLLGKHIDTTEWLVSKNTPEFILLISRDGEKSRRYVKETDKIEL